jgi:FMN-dependent dehydrogenase
MIVSSASDYREAARRKLPRFLFDYIDGGANAEQTLKANIADLIGVSLRQRVLKDVSDLSLGTEWVRPALRAPGDPGPRRVERHARPSRRGSGRQSRSEKRYSICLIDGLGLFARRSDIPVPAPNLVPALRTKGSRFHAKCARARPVRRREKSRLYSRPACARIALSGRPFGHVRSFRHAAANSAGDDETRLGHRRRS